MNSTLALIVLPTVGAVVAASRLGPRHVSVAILGVTTFVLGALLADRAPVRLVFVAMAVAFAGIWFTRFRNDVVDR